MVRIAMFHVKHCGGKKEDLSAGTERFHVKHFGNSAKMTNIAGARVERGAILVVVGLATKTKVQARRGKWKKWARQGVAGLCGKIKRRKAVQCSER